MMAYKIRKILIENFKPIDQALLDFSKKDLIVFDGPNGFGKTTLFDAIELVVRGQISRVTNTTDGRYGYNDLLFSKNKDKDTIIKIEFYNKEQSFTIVKKFDCSIPLKSPDRKPDNWGLFRTYLLENFNDPLLDENFISPEEIYSKLKIDDFNRYFSLFYYIQQEENTYFLKKSAKDRMNEIAQLFDTYQEQEDLDKLERLKNELEKEKRKINGDTGLLSEKKKTLKALTTGLQDIDTNKLVYVEYFRLLQTPSPLKEWDKKDISVQKKTRDLYLKDLRQLYDFVNNFEEFLKAQMNKDIQNYVENTRLLNDTIIAAYFFEDYDRLKELKNKENRLRKLKKILTKDNLQKNLGSLPFKEIDTLIETDVNTETIKAKFQLLKEYKDNANELSSILQELNTTRETLMEHFNKINHLGLGNHEQCPLCGHGWVSYEQLMENVQSKKETFQKYYDSSSQKYEEELDSLFINHLKPILNWIDEYLINPKNIINEEFFKQLTDGNKRKQTISQFSNWCENNNIDLNLFINQEKEAVIDLETKREELVKFLTGLKQNIKQGYAEFDEKFSEFNSLYQDLFESKEEQVRLITLGNIINKANYINYQYYHRSSESIKQLETEISQLKSRFEQVNLGIEKMKNAIRIYTKRISQHWKKIMRDIEIPFYIYSGKILQDYQRGLGLFIQESDGDGVKSIKFVSDSKSDHDAVNYLSSGQLSGLVIAFTLALNKVYGNNSMDILLIDDPVQTMDEINMASFVELLRNEFKNKQIFLSTHEDDVSRYVRYKFKKYNLETLRFNVKDKLYTNSYKSEEERND